MERPLRVPRVAWIVGVLPLVLGCGNFFEPRAVQVSPVSATLGAGASQTFTAILAVDSRRQGVSWELSNCGSDPSVCGALSDVTGTSTTYTAPATGAYHVVYLTARPVADPTSSSTAVIEVGRRCVRFCGRP